MHVQDNGPTTRGGRPAHSLTGAEFRRRFRWLVFHSWNIPPVFGLGFILLIGILTPAQLLGILTTPLEPAYIIGWLAFAMWYLPRRVRPVSDWLDGKPGSSPEQAMHAVRRFPLVYWATFVVYLVLAPVSVIAAAHMYTDFVATPLALFRIELVALIVSIIVGLPIFFLIFDLFGKALGGLELKQPIVKISTKVFLIGALVPLLIDTMLVQYYWTRTGFFNIETFGVWLLLEALAIGGSLIFAHSFGQSLSPLQNLIGVPRPLPEANIAGLRPRSTDELGLLTKDYRLLLDELSLHNEVLELNNRLLRIVGSDPDTGTVFNTVVNLCKQALHVDQAFLILYDPDTRTLVGVAQTDSEYRPEGHYRIALDEPSLAVTAFMQQKTVLSEDAASDPRVSTRLRTRFDIRSALATPLKLSGEVLGVLMVSNSTAADAYGARELALIDGLAREVALAVQTQRLRETRKQANAALLRHNQLLRTMASSTEMLVRERGEQQFMTDICRLLVDEGRFRMAWVGMIESDGVRVKPMAEAGFEQGYLEQANIRCDESPQGQGPSGMAIRLGKSVINDDTETNLHFAPWRERARAQGYRSSMATPLHMHGQIVGALSVYSAKPHAFSDDDVVLIEKLATDLGLTLERHAAQKARLQSEDRLKRQQNALIVLADHQAMAASDINSVLQAVTETMADTLEVRRASVWQLASDDKVLACLDLYELDKHAHSSNAMLEETDYPGYFGALRENRIIAASDAHKAPETFEFSESYLKPLGIGAMLDAPIQRAGQPIGVLCCEHVGGPRVWTVDEQNFASAVADFISLCLELNEHHQTAEDLRQHREKLEEMVAARTAEVQEKARIIDQIHDSVVTTDLAGRIIGWNKGAERLFGYAAEEALGRNIAFVYPPEDQVFLLNKVIAPLQAHGEHELEVRMIRKSGVIFPAHLSLSLLYGQDGRPRGMVGYSLDISERKRAEALASERAHELEAFSYSVSHDLRAPLRAVDGFARALAEDYGHCLDGEAQDYLRRVRGGTQRMGLLIDDLLQLSRIGRVAFNPADVNLSMMARDIMDPLTATAPDRSIDLSIAPEMKALGDERLLHIALTNLLDNAWKYTGKTDAARIEFGAQKQDGETVYFVRDNGVGFDMQYAGKLFGAFQRLHGAEFPGTGIGLATVARIIHRHGGRIWANSAIGKGASFHFTLGPQP